MNYRNLLYIPLLLLIISTACSKDTAVNPDEEKADNTYTSFKDETELAIPSSTPESFAPKSVKVSGDTLFVVNSHANDRAIYIISLSTNTLISKLTSWEQAGKTRTFTSDITDIAIGNKQLFVGVQSSNVFVFNRKDLSLANVIGNADGNWGGGIYDMIHCYGLAVSDENLIVRDKSSLRAYWLYEVLTEPSSQIPWLGTVTNGNLGYDYNPTMHGMVEYKKQLYVTDWYARSIQVITPSKFKVVFGETTNIKTDTVFQLSKIQPIGISASGGKLLVSYQNGSHVLGLSPTTGAIVDTVATFKNRLVGRMQLSNGFLYFIDLKGNKVVRAKGYTST